MCNLRIEWKMIPASMTAVFSVSEAGEYFCSPELASEMLASEPSLFPFDSTAFAFGLSNMWRFRSTHLCATYSMRKVKNKPAIRIAPVVASYSTPSRQSLLKNSCAWVKSYLTLALIFNSC